MNVKLTRWISKSICAGILLILFLFSGGCLDFANHNAAGKITQANGKIECKGKTEMVNLIERLHVYAKAQNPSFQLIGNNGLELYTPAEGYSLDEVKRLINSVDGIIMEEYYYGWEMNDDQRTPPNTQRELSEYLKLPVEAGMPILNIDYAKKIKNMDRSYELNDAKKFIGFAANSRQLDRVPSYPTPIHAENNSHMAELKQIQNFLILLNPEKFASKKAYIQALQSTNYDLLIIDLTFNGDPLTKEEVISLKRKANGAARLVFAYMSTGEAESYRPYWHEEWTDNPPDWIAEENPDWAENYKVKYWEDAWQKILYGTPDSYLDQILSCGFDGAFLDVIDAFNYFEHLQ